eukprot:NODE_265_length_11346_cov_0.635814.p5 type:complete len:231 gc:universal NODE_265_length_11346_cov_0.635814:9595-10287(+)
MFVYFTLLFGFVKYLNVIIYNPDRKHRIKLLDQTPDRSIFDKSWDCSSEGTYSYPDLFSGEWLDATHEPEKCESSMETYYMIRFIEKYVKAPGYKIEIGGRELQFPLENDTKEIMINLNWSAYSKLDVMITDEKSINFIKLQDQSPDSPVEDKKWKCLSMGYSYEQYKSYSTYGILKVLGCDGNMDINSVIKFIQGYSQAAKYKIEIGGKLTRFTYQSNVKQMMKDLNNE